MSLTENFMWGVSSSAFQTEGGTISDNRGDSSWDIFARKKNKIYGGHSPDEACDFYNRYEEDLSLMQQMQIPNFRFSVSWPRILPQGTTTINPKGLDYYDRLVDTCLSKGIDPWVTLYHWDLPHILELKGGWTNRDIIHWFNEYVFTVISRLGDRVKNWMVLNEPGVFTGAGYFLGVHAPGKKGLSNYLAAVHHSALCQANGIRIIKKHFPEANVGTTFSCSQITPLKNTLKDYKAAERVDAVLNRLFIEPLLGYGYPVTRLPVLSRIEKYMKSGDAEQLVAIPDFAGIQNYTREVVTHSYLTPYLHAKMVDAKSRNVPYTQMNWEVYPSSLYAMLMQFASYPALKKLYVTENGAAFNDQLIGGKVHDPERTNYLQSCIREMNRAKNAGAPVHGYFVWSFTDNFEWTEGYFPRFGLVYIDYKTQQRIVKSSGKWYTAFIAAQLKKEKRELIPQ